MRHLARVAMVVAVLLAGIVLPGSAAQACNCACRDAEAKHQARGRGVLRRDRRPDAYAVRTAGLAMDHHELVVHG